MMPLLRFRSVTGIFAIALVAFAVSSYGLQPLHGQTSNDDVAVAESLSTLLQESRTVVSRHQNEINNPDVGDKGFTGAKVLAEAATSNYAKRGVERYST